MTESHDLEESKTSLIVWSPYVLLKDEIFVERTSSLHRSDTRRQDDAGIRDRSTAVGNQTDTLTLSIDWDDQDERYKT